MKAERQKVQKASAEQAMGYRALENPRHEAFILAHTEGLPAYRAYLQAGYKCTVKTAMVESSKLLRNPKVWSRRRELVEALAESSLITKETLVAEYDQAIALAHEQGQASAATAAIAAKQRLVGLDPMTKSMNLNVSGSFNSLTDDELTFELASMINEARAAAGKPALPLPQTVEVEKKH